MKILDCKGYNYLFIIKDNFSGWVKVKSIKTLISIKVIKFIYNKIIYKYSIFGKLKVNKGSEFKKSIIIEFKKLGIARIVIFIYNIRVNSIIKYKY